MSIKIIFSNISLKKLCNVLPYNFIHNIIFLIIVHVFEKIFKVVNFLLINFFLLLKILFKEKRIVIVVILIVLIK